MVTTSSLEVSEVDLNGAVRVNICGWLCLFYFLLIAWLCQSYKRLCRKSDISLHTYMHLFACRNVFDGLYGAFGILECYFSIWIPGALTIEIDFLLTVLPLPLTDINVFRWAVALIYLDNLVRLKALLVRSYFYNSNPLSTRRCHRRAVATREIISFTLRRRDWMPATRI